MNDKLSAQLWDAYRYMDICRQYDGLIYSYKNDSSACEEKYLKIKNEKHSGTIVNVIVILMAFFWSSLFLAAELYLLPLVIIAAAVLIISLNNKSVKKNKKKALLDADKFWNEIGSPTVLQNQETVKKIEDEYFSFCSKNEHVMDIIPVSYQNNYQAVAYITSAVMNERADTIKEAVNLYEEQLHRWKMESSMEKIAQQQSAINAELKNIHAEQIKIHSTLQDIETLTFLDYVDRKYC